MGRYTAVFDRDRTQLVLQNGTLVQFPGTARLTQFTDGGGRLRDGRLPAEIDTSLAFHRAMLEVGIIESETIHLDVDRAGTGADDTLVLEPALPATGPCSRAAVLYQDESGGLSWHFADRQTEPPTTPARPGLRATPAPRFVIPLRTAPARKSAASVIASTRLRGPITKWGRKVFKVLVMPLAAESLGRPLQALVSEVERRHRAECIWRVTSDSYTRSPTPPDDEFREWAALAGKRSLLIIHGIFSSVEGMLALLPRNHGGVGVRVRRPGVGLQSPVRHQVAGRELRVTSSSRSSGPHRRAGSRSTSWPTAAGGSLLGRCANAAQISSRAITPISGRCTSWRPRTAVRHSATRSTWLT